MRGALPADSEFSVKSDEGMPSWIKSQEEGGHSRLKKWRREGEVVLPGAEGSCCKAERKLDWWSV